MLVQSPLRSLRGPAGARLARNEGRFQRGFQEVLFARDDVCRRSTGGELPTRYEALYGCSGTHIPGSMNWRSVHPDLFP